MAEDEAGIEDAFAIGLGAWPADGLPFVAFQLSHAARLAGGTLSAGERELGDGQLTSLCATSSVQLSAETHAQGALGCKAHSGGESGAGMEVVWVWVRGVPWSSALARRTGNTARARGACAREVRGRRIFSAPQLALRRHR